ncbi:MAG: CPBP family glutamic-type intramembrane protease [Flavobacteriales bacterium]
MRAIIQRFPVLTFVLLTLLYQFVVVGVVWSRLPVDAHINDDDISHMIFRFRVFGPLVFAVGLTAYLEGWAGVQTLFGGFLKWKVPPQWYAFAISWKFLFTWAGIGFLAIMGIREWPGLFVENMIGGDWSTGKALLSNMGFIVGIAFVEETAWMKFSVTRLQDRMAALPACLLVGCGWALWYLPMLLIEEGTPDGYPTPVFMLSMVCLTILLGWTYNMTRSGTVLLVMQIISNCAFFLIPVLPTFWGLDPSYINAFVGVNFVSALAISLIYGWRELGTRPRATWSESHAEVLERAKGSGKTERIPAH